VPVRTAVRGLSQIGVVLVKLPSVVVKDASRVLSARTSRSFERL
jgi:hypothetical protein